MLFFGRIPVLVYTINYCAVLIGVYTSAGIRPQTEHNYSVLLRIVTFCFEHNGFFLKAQLRLCYENHGSVGVPGIVL